MKNLSNLFLCLFLSTTLTAQTSGQGFKWIQHHGDEISSPAEQLRKIQTDRWGNVYVAGQVNDLFVRDSNGSIIRSKEFPTTDSLFNRGGADVWLAKYSPDGKLLWHRYAGSGSDDSYFDMVADKDGNCYVAGELKFHSLKGTKTFAGNRIPVVDLGAFIAKVDSGGNLLWHQSFGGDSVPPNNTFINYAATQLNLTLIDNGISCFFRGGGSTQSTHGFQKLFDRDSLNLGVHEARFDLNGNYLGAKSFPFPDFHKIPQIRNIHASKNGRVISGNINRDTVLVGTDTLLRGSNFNNAFVFGFDSSLNHLWTFKSDNWFDQFLASSISGDTLSVSGHFSLFNNPTVSFDTVQFSGNPNATQGGALFLFSVSSGRLIGFYPAEQKGNSASTFSEASGISDKYMGIGGCFKYRLSYSGTNNFLEAASSRSNQDLHFAVFDRQGNFVAEDKIFSSASSNVDVNLAMHFDDSTVYIGGIIGDTAILPGIDTFVSRGNFDAFIAAYRLDVITSLDENTGNFIKAEKGILAYPNPTQGLLSLMGKAVGRQAALFDIKGKRVKEYRLDVNAFQQQISLAGLPSGIYFLVIQGAEDRQELKLIKTD